MINFLMKNFVIHYSSIQLKRLIFSSAYFEHLFHTKKKLNNPFWTSKPSFGSLKVYLAISHVPKSIPLIIPIQNVNWSLTMLIWPFFLPSQLQWRLSMLAGTTIKITTVIFRLSFIITPFHLHISLISISHTLKKQHSVPNFKP